MNAPLPMNAAAQGARPTLAELEARDAFAARHIGPDSAEQQHMLKVLGFDSRAALIDAVVPAAIRRCLDRHPEIAYAVLDAHDLLGPR